MKRTLLLMLVIAATLLSACATRSAPAKAPSVVEMPFATAPSLSRAAGAAAPPAPQEFSAQSDTSNSGGQAPAATDRLVIQTADLTIVVADVNARVTAIQQMAATMGGFVVSANVYQVQTGDGTPVPQAQIVVRVPQDKLNAALDQVKAGTVDIQSETRSGQDVTDQYVDLQSRLTAKQAAQDQLLKIMQNATKTQDVLDVYAQLQQVQTDIEVLKGQMKYLEQSSALSALSVTVIAEKTIKPIQVGGWKPQGVARDAIQNLVNFEQGFADFMIRFVLLILPVLITIGIPFYLLFLVLRWLFRRTRRPKSVPPTAEPKK
jgi:hypothetical protein